MIGRPGRHGDGSSGWLFLAAAFSMMGIMIGLVAVTRVLGPVAIPIWMTVMVGLGVVSRGPIGKAIGARIHPENLDSGEHDQVVPPELYAELDELRARVNELEDRQEFSERLLARRADEQGTM